MAKQCNCSVGSTLVFACSGAADVGEVADLAARRIARDGAGKMFCLAGLGGRVQGIVAGTKAADRVLAIDGCDLDCARHTLELVGIEKFEHLRVTNLGFEKGGTGVTEETVAKVSREVCSLLNRDDSGKDKA